MGAGKIPVTVVFFIVFFYPVSNRVTYAATPWLHVDGNEIKDPHGNIVVLRGVSLIDLGSQQAWHGGAINMINRLTNKNNAEGNSLGWYTRVIRIPVFPSDSHLTSPPPIHWPYEFNPKNNNLYNLLRPVVDYCAKKDVYAVINWHYIANTYDKVAETNEFWEYMAPRFACDSHVIFELFCEPINDEGTDEENWLSVRDDMQTWINTVRTYAPNNLIFVGTPRYCQIIGPTADHPVDGNNIVYVSHIYPEHWLSDNPYYRDSITAAAAVHPVIMGEWGFSQSAADPKLQSTITNYGQPLKEFLEGLGIGSIAWVASYGRPRGWEPPMFYPNWTLRCYGEGEMGCFAKDWLYEKRTTDLTVTQCTVTAGSKDNSDTISFSGTMDATADDISAASAIEVTIDSDNIANSCVLTFPINGKTFKNGRYSYSGIGNGVRKSFTYNLKTRKFSFAASNIDLSGLGCPVTIEIEIGDYNTTAEVGEAIVNGFTMPIPIQLMMGVKDVLRVDKCQVKHGRKLNTDQLSVNGAFAVENTDVNMANRVSEGLVVTLGAQQFTIPADKLKAGKGKFTCLKADVNEGGIAAATFNFNMCSFILTIKNTEITAGPGAVDFGIAFAGYNQCVQITLP